MVDVWGKVQKPQGSGHHQRRIYPEQYHRDNVLKVMRVGWSVCVGGPGGDLVGRSGYDERDYNTYWC